MDKDTLIFKDTSLSDLLEEVVVSSRTRKKFINSLTKQFAEQPDAKSLILVLPLIKEYLEVGIKNDEHIIKVSALIQRLISEDKESGLNGDLGSVFGMISDEEQEKVRKEIEDMRQEQLTLEDTNSGKSLSYMVTGGKSISPTSRDNDR